MRLTDSLLCAACALQGERYSVSRHRFRPSVRHCGNTSSLSPDRRECRAPSQCTSHRHGAKQRRGRHCSGVRAACRDFGTWGGAPALASSIGGRDGIEATPDPGCLFHIIVHPTLTQRTHHHAASSVWPSRRREGNPGETSFRSIQHSTHLNRGSSPEGRRIGNTPGAAGEGDHGCGTSRPRRHHDRDRPGYARFPGFILDGFPRTLPQAKALSRIFEELGIRDFKVIEFAVDDEEVIRRITSRLVCTKDNGVYNRDVDGLAAGDPCPSCGTPLAQRDDDREETVRERLKLYHSTTEPIIHFYTSSGVVLRVDGAGSIDVVSREIKVMLRDSGKP